MALKVADIFARVGLTLAAIVAIAVAVYAWWDGHLLSPVRLVLFAVLPVVCGGLCVIAALSGPTLRWQIATNLCAVAIALAGFEFYLRYSEARAETGTGEVERRPKSHPDYLPQTCSVSVPRTGLKLASGDLVIPFGGVSNSEIYWKGYTLTTDRYGFKNPDHAWTVDDSTLFIGDSFTYGANAPPDGGFVELIRNQGVPSINLGCGGNGPVAELGSLIEYVSVASPRRVVWVYYEGNDLTKDIWRELNFPLFARYLEPSAAQGLVGKQALIDSALRTHIAALRKGSRRAGDTMPDLHPLSLADWRGFVGLTYTRNRMGLNYGIKPGAIEAFGKVLEIASSIARKANAERIFVYLPGQYRYTTLLGGPDADGYGEAVKRLATAAGFTIVDVDEALRRSGQEPSDFYDGHFNAEGHKLVADVIAAGLAN